MHEFQNCLSIKVGIVVHIKQSPAKSAFNMGPDSNPRCFTVTQLPINGSEKAADNGSTAWAYAIHIGSKDGFALDYPIPGTEVM